MTGWTTITLVPDDEHTAEELYDQLTDHLDQSDVGIYDESVSARQVGYDAQKGKSQDVATVLKRIDGWRTCARIDANDTTGSGTGWIVEPDGAGGLSYGRTAHGAESARAHDVRAELEGRFPTGVHVR